MLDRFESSRHAPRDESGARIGRALDAQPRAKNEFYPAPAIHHAERDGYMGRQLRRTLLLGTLLLAGSIASAAEVHTFSGTIGSVQPKMVKLYGAGGVRGLEAYQSDC